MLVLSFSLPLLRKPLELLAAYQAGVAHEARQRGGKVNELLNRHVLYTLQHERENLARRIGTVQAPVTTHANCRFDERREVQSAEVRAEVRGGEKRARGAALRCLCSGQTWRRDAVE